MWVSTGNIGPNCHLNTTTVLESSALNATALHRAVCMDTPVPQWPSSAGCMMRSVTSAARGWGVVVLRLVASQIRDGQDRAQTAVADGGGRIGHDRSYSGGVLSLSCCINRGFVNHVCFVLACSFSFLSHIRSAYDSVRTSGTC